MKYKKIRRLQNNPDEIDQLCQIAEDHRSAHFNWPRDLLVTEIKSASAVVVLETDEGLLGFVILKSNDSADEVTCLALKKTHLQKGLMAELLVGAINTFCHKPEIWLEVHASNLKALKLYHHLGFKQVRVRKKYYSDGGDALLMSCPRR